MSEEKERDFKLQDYEPPEQVVLNRITHQSNLYYQFGGEDPQQWQLNSVKLLKSETEDCEPFSRKSKAEQDWKPLIPKGNWVEECSMLLVFNLTGKSQRAVNPTEEQKEEDANRILEISFNQSDQQSFLIGPGGSLVCTPSDLSTLSVRADQATMYRVVVFPK